MKYILAGSVAILSFFLALPVTAANRVEATLTLPHDRVLPGIPFDLVVTYTNVSDQPVTIHGATATLVVTFAGGETVVLNRPERHEQWDLEPVVPLRLAPGESVQQSASWERGIPNWFHTEPAFSGPGTYGFALDLRIVNETLDVLGIVRTPAATLTRIEPVGIDAELWKRMQGLSGGRWTDGSFMANNRTYAALADEIVQLHPESGYYPYILALRALHWPYRKDIRIPALLEAAGRFQASPAYPYLLKAAGDSARTEAWKAQHERNEIETVKYFDLAQRYYRDALATKSVAVRAEAEKGLRDVAQGMEPATKQRQ